MDPSDRDKPTVEMLIEAIKVLVCILQDKNEYTVGHSRRVAEYAVSIAERLALPQKEIENIRLAALLHDIGVIGIREGVLGKPGKLSAEEYDHVKTHPLVAERILKPIPELKDIVAYIKHKNEAYDGSGYPDGLKGEEIPLGARIIAVAEAFDAMTSDRPYRRATRPEEAMAELERKAGSQFDPKIVEIFRQIRGVSQARLVVGPLCLDCRTFEVTVEGKTVLLTPVEFDLLHYLMSHAGEVISAERLLQEVWGYPPGTGSPDLVRVHIRNLRRKIEPSPSNPIYIRNVPRHGYIIRPLSEE